MINILRSTRRAGLFGAAALALVGCKMDVTNPQVIDASRFDPSSDGPALSLSAQQNFYFAYTTVALRGGYFAEELWATSPGDVYEKQFAQRNFDFSNRDIGPYLFDPLSLSIATNEQAVDALAAGPNASSDVNLARAAMNSGFSFVLMAETFCESSVLGGPAITTDMVLDSAVARFTQAITVGTAAGGAEGSKIVNAATVGLARAYLQKGDYVNAAKYANQEIANDLSGTFAYNAIYSGAGDNSYYNTINTSTAQRLNTVPTVYRNLGDTRVAFADSSATTTLDGFLPFYPQQKYATTGDPIRVASTLEAKYIAAEADLQGGNPVTATTLIAARRAIDPGANYLTTAPLLTQLEDVRLRDFWLEAKKMGDTRRNPTNTPYFSAAGTPFYENGGVFGTLTCFPIPQSEVLANPKLQ